MTPYKVAFIVDEGAIHTFMLEYALMPLLRNLLREHEQVELFACREGETDDLCARVDYADVVFCYVTGESNISAAVRYAEEQGKPILHLEPTEEELAVIREKQHEHACRYPGLFFLD